MGESAVCYYLEALGYRILARNFRIRGGEIDIVAARDSDLCFVEVKTRTYTSDSLQTAPPPKHAVHAEKQRLTRQAARQYLHEHPTKKQPRMDVIEVWLLKENESSKIKVAKIHHIKAAY